MDLRFIAKKSGAEWSNTIESEPGFSKEIEDLPSSFVEDRLRRFLAGTQPFDVETDLGLPWQIGRYARWSGGPHGNSGGRPFNSIDFVPDGVIRAPAAGVFDCECDRVRIRIDHGGGISTQYYHVDDATSIPRGSMVNEGDYLGRISARTDCGGRASGPHVHFSLWRRGDPIKVDGKIIGGWMFHEGNQNYKGWAVDQKTGREVRPGGRLINYGSPSRSETVSEEDPYR